MKGATGLMKGNDGDLLRTVDAAQIAGARLRYFDFAMAAFVTILLLSNALGAGKVAVIDLPGIGAWPFGAGLLFFTLGVVLGDVLTVVYVYDRARPGVAVGFAVALCMWRCVCVE